MQDGIFKMILLAVNYFLMCLKLLKILVSDLTYWILILVIKYAFHIEEICERMSLIPFYLVNNYFSYFYFYLIIWIFTEKASFF